MNLLKKIEKNPGYCSQHFPLIVRGTKRKDNKCKRGQGERDKKLYGLYLNLYTQITPILFLNMFGRTPEDIEKLKGKTKK